VEEANRERKPMNLEDVKKQLREFIRARFNVPDNDADFSDDVHLFDYGYVDSFGAVELTTFVKEKFDIEVKDTDLIAYPMNTISEIAQFVVTRRAASHS
jgi:methoxymalonate biosynthesis acyl carrier protein